LKSNRAGLGREPQWGEKEFGVQETEGSENVCNFSHTGAERENVETRTIRA